MNGSFVVHGFNNDERQRKDKHTCHSHDGVSEKHGYKGSQRMKSDKISYDSRLERLAGKGYYKIKHNGLDCHRVVSYYKAYNTPGNKNRSASEYRQKVNYRNSQSKDKGKLKPH